jgi:hypothetical protein
VRPKETDKSEIDSLDLHSKAEAKRRTDALLRNLLNTPPVPHAPKVKPKKRVMK